MILDFDYVHKKYDLNITGILHIGGHYGNVISDYQKYGVNNIVLFEPLGENFSILSENIKKTNANIVAHQVALGNDNKKVVMNVSDNEGQSSSVLNPKVHLTAHPEVSFIGTEEVEMKKLDDYNYNDYNMMVIDVQGYELEVFRGGVKTLENIDYIFCEVNRDEVYEGNAKIEEIDDFLLKQGFERVEVEWYYSQVFGDAFYIRNKKKNPNANVSLICACKNRYNALKLSLNSWLMFDEVKEVIIVDWSSDVPINDLLELDERVKIIRVEDKKYFNLCQPLNLAASIATGDYILKVDCDYIINPYYNFFESYSVDETCFVSGAHDSPDLVYGPDQNGEYTIDMAKNEFMNVVDYVNCFSQYFRYLRGMLYVSRENFLKVNGYNESIDTYGFEDGDMETKLKSLGLTHKKISYDHSLIHIPHSDKKRIENCKYDLYDEKEIRSNLSNYYSGDILEAQTYYGVVSRLVQKNGDASRRKGRKITWKIDQIDDQNYVAKDTIMLKLKEFPSVNYVSLEESTDRQITLVNQFYEHGITNINSVISKRFAESNDVVTGKYAYTLNDGTKGCVVSHLKAIKNWYENTDEDYGFFCEDDLSLETIQYWNFTWEEFIKKIPLDTECIQLLTIRGDFETFELRERQWNDWAATAYIITRDYAMMLIDSYIQNDTYHLDVPNSEVMPLIENLLFVGKTYTVPLFVENIEFNSTFVGFDDDVNDGQKRDHYYAHETVLNYWKSLGKTKLKSFKIIVKKIEKTIEEQLLHNYALDPENPEHNFQLGLWYEKEGHNSAALSYFLRCAERSEDDTLTYEALIHGSNCYDRQGTRDLTAKGILQQALMVLPNRPEAYFLLSRFSERREYWQDCYIYANNGLEHADFDLEPLREDVEYPGRYGLLYEKSVASWWWGKGEETRQLLQEIKENYELTPEYSENVHSNMILANLKYEDITSNFEFDNVFDWGTLTYEDIVTIQREIQYENVYEFWRGVRQNDVIVDVGASVGPFVCSIMSRNPQKIYCIEPSKDLLEILDKNINYYFPNKRNKLVYVNRAIIDDPNQKVNIFGGNSDFEVATFEDVMNENSINKIDFLKIDCEGGEYSIFNDKNIDFLINNVEFIAMETHLNYPGYRDKFKKLRDNYLIRFNNFKVMSCTRQNISWGNSIDIKENIFDDEFIDNYTCEFMIYIWNLK